MDLDLILGSDLSDYTIMETSTEKRWVQLKRWDRNHPVTIPFSKDSVVVPLNLNLLHVVDPVELEPHSQQQVRVRVSRTVDYDEAFCSLAQPANPRSSVMMANHVIFPSQQEHVVLMLNANKEPVYLSEGTVVGKVTSTITPDEINNAVTTHISLKAHEGEESKAKENASGLRVARVGDPVENISDQVNTRVRTEWKPPDPDELYGEEDPRAEILKTTENDYKDVKIYNGLTLRQKARLAELIRRYKDLWYLDGYGKARCKPLVIETTGPPVAKPPYRQGEEKTKEIRKMVQDMLRDGVASPSESPWSAPCMLIPKRDGSSRFVIDYRALNRQTVLRNFPMPHMSDAIRLLRGMSYFSVFDARSGYWQLPLDKSTKHKTAFVTSDGLYEFNCLSFGLKNGPSEYSAFLSQVLGSMRYGNAMAYLDDTIVYSKTFEDHLKHLEELFERFRKARITLKASKCQVAMEEVEYLGLLCSKRGVRINPKRIEAVLKIVPPRNIRGVRQFLGLSNYYRKFLERYAELVHPIQLLTSPKNRFEWTEQCQKAFETIKEALTSAPILIHPDLEKRFSLKTDASQYAVGAVLSQMVKLASVSKSKSSDEMAEAVVEYFSKSLKGAQLNWTATERECYGILLAVRHFREFLYKPFTLETDHKALLHMFTRPFADNRKVSRWAVEISQYPCEFKFKQGESNTDADALSRLIDPFRQGLVSPLGLDIDDNCENMEVYKAVLPLLSHHKDSRVYEPFRGSGRSGRLLVEWGFTKVIHPMTNFLNASQRLQPGDYDVVISHPPRSLLRRIFAILTSLKKPFCLWCPAGVLTREYCPRDHVQVVIVRGEYRYDGYKKPSRTRSIWVCWRMNLKSQLAFTDLSKVQGGDSPLSVVDSKVESKGATSSGVETRGRVRKSPKQRSVTTTTIRRMEGRSFEVTPRVLPEVFVRSLDSWRVISKESVVANVPDIRAISLREKEKRSDERATLLDWETEPSMTRLASAQEQDEGLKDILLRLRTQAKASQGTQLLQVPRGTGYYFEDANGFLRWTPTVDDFEVNGDLEEKLPLVIPKSLRKRLLFFYHNSLWAMHMGWQKGAKLLQQKYYWFGMRNQMKNHVNLCLQCRQAKSTRPRRQGLTKLFFRTGPFEVLHVDFVGQFGDDKGGFNYIFTVIDSFSRWVHLIPVKDEKALTAAKALVRHVITVHGCPLRIVSDKGASFVAKLWQKLGEVLEIKMTLASPRHPQSNGSAERVHRTLNSVIRATCKPNDSWSAMIPFVEWAYRTMPLAGVGLSPFQILYGRDPVMPTDLQFASRTRIPPGEAPSVTEINDYVERAMAQIKLARQAVRQADLEQKRKAKRRRDIGRKHVTFDIGDRVLVYMPKAIEGVPQRRVLQWTGLATVRSKRADNSYNVMRDGKTSEEAFNVDRLIKVPKETKVLEPELDVDNKMFGLLQIPAEAKARKDALEHKRTERKRQEILAARSEEPQRTEGKVKTHPGRSRPGRSRPAEQKFIAKPNYSPLEALAEDLELRSWEQLRVGDNAIHFNQEGKRWLPVQVLSLLANNKARVQYLWPKSGTSAADNATVNWAPLWMHAKKVNGQQRSQWKKPDTHKPYVEECKRSSLKYIGLQLQAYSTLRRGRGQRRHRIHPVWWKLIEKDSAVFRAFAMD